MKGRPMCALVAFAVIVAWISFFPMLRSWPIRALLAGCALMVVVLGAGRETRLVTRRDWPVTLLLLGYTTSLLAAGDKAAAWILYAELTVILAVAYHLGKGVFLDRRLWRPAAVIVVAAGVVVAVWGILESLTGCNPLYAEGGINPYYDRFVQLRRPVATQYHYAPLSTYLLAVWPFALFLMHSVSAPRKKWAVAAAILCLACLALTLNRSAYFALLVMVPFYFVLRGRGRRAAMLCACLVAIAIVATFLPAPVNRIGLRGLALQERGTFSAYRLTRIEMAWEMFKDNPDFGVGLRHFRLLFEHYYPKPEMVDLVPYEIRVADNMYATLLAETGAFGTMAFLVFVSALLLGGFRTLRRSNDPVQRELLCITMAGLVGLLLSMAGYEMLYWRGPCLLFCLLSGILAGVRDTLPRRAEAGVSPA